MCSENIQLRVNKRRIIIIYQIRKFGWSPSMINKFFVGSFVIKVYCIWQLVKVWFFLSFFKPFEKIIICGFMNLHSLYIQVKNQNLKNHFMRSKQTMFFGVLLIVIIWITKLFIHHGRRVLKWLKYENLEMNMRIAIYHWILLRQIFAHLWFGFHQMGNKFWLVLRIVVCTCLIWDLQSRY